MTSRSSSSRALAWLAILVGLAAWIWLDWQADARRANVAARPAPPRGMFLHYPEPELQARLKADLERAGVPYRLVKGTLETVHVEAPHRAAAEPVLAAIDGPPLPPHGAMHFDDSPRHRAFTEWLTANGVKWEMIVRRKHSYIAWENLPGHNLLYAAFTAEEAQPWGRVDQYAMRVAARGVPAGELDANRFAAFRAPAHRERFVAWLEEQHGVKARTVTLNGREFITWESGEMGFLHDYINEMYRRCRAEARNRELGAPLPAVPAVC